MAYTEKDIQSFYSDTQSKAAKYATNEAYLKGKNPEILTEPEKKDPDNRIPIPFAKMEVEDIAGYAARPGDITIEYVNVEDPDFDSTDDLYNDIVKYWQESNDDNIEISELYQKMLGHGAAYEIWWTEEDEKFSGLPIKAQWKRVEGKSIIINYSDSLKPEKTDALYFRIIDPNTDNEKILCDVYYPLKSEQWIKTKGEFERNPEGDREYPFSVVPVLEYVGTMDKSVIFEAEKEIINAHDKLLSKSVNEIDRFNALIALFPGKVTKEFVDRLVELKVIDELGQFERWPEYLEKNLSGVNEFYNQLADRLERLFRTSSKVPDFMSDTVGSADQSGVARAFKLLGMEFKVSMIETYFKRGLMERKQLIDDIFNDGSTLNLDTESYKTVIHTKRNLPVDELTKVQIAVQLKDLVSDETLLKFLPQSIVDDPKAELEKLQQKLEERGEELQRLIGEGDEPEEQIEEQSERPNIEVGATQPDVQKAALNGAQIKSLLDITLQVAQGMIPKNTGVEIILTSIPSIDEQTARDIIEPIEVKEINDTE